ncbi:MAG: PBSX family phage terminase large subunit [Clostridia bacterium]
MGTVNKNGDSKVRLTDLIAPKFFQVHKAIQNHEYTHYWLCGGRGSTKSSFASIEIILGIMQNPLANAVAIRKVGLYLKDSVFSQLKWAIDRLGVTQAWQVKHSPMELIYIKTGQKILFRGADKPQKLKSTKVENGYIAYIWYEELDEFNGMAEIRSINQSLMRGGELFTVFYSYNPPKSKRNWVNREVGKERSDRLVHHSVYLDVDRSWLGTQFFLEAEQLKKTNPELYAHEYLGSVTGTGGEVFKNITVRHISDEEISMFDKIYCGIDFGYAADPFVYLACYYNKNRLFIFDEIFAVGMSNTAAAEKIKEKKICNKPIICDSAEPKSIRDLREHGLRVRGAKKGPDSIEYGIKFLQSLDEIIIDGKRCPNAEREFCCYAIEKDINGEFKSCYPDRDNHTIDAARYALEEEINHRHARVIKRREFNL